MEELKQVLLCADDDDIPLTCDDSDILIASGPLMNKTFVK